MNIIRIRKGWVQTPIVKLIKDERVVLLIGVMHVGTPKYFEQIRQLLTKKQEKGWVVLAERLLDEGDYTPHSMEYFHTTERLYRKFIKSKLGLVYQPDVLPRNPQWIDADIPNEKRREMLSWDRHDVAKRIRDLRKRLSHPSVVLEFNQQMVKLAKNPTLLKKHVLHEIVVDKRDVYAAKVICKHSRSRHVVTFWGTGHVPGITDQLIQKGFIPGPIRWISSFQMK